MSSSGRSSRRTRRYASPVSNSSTASVAQPITRGWSCQICTFSAEVDAVAVGRGALQQARLVACPAVGLASAAPVRSRGVAAPVDLRAADAHRHGQALHQGLGALDAGRAADVGGQPVHVVGHQRTGRVAPADAESLLHAEQEGRRHGQRQQQEQRHQPHAQRMRECVTGAAVPAGWSRRLRGAAHGGLFGSAPGNARPNASE